MAFVKVISMPYKYFYLNRPPGIGCQPSGYSERETWYPKQFRDEFPRGAWGWVTYPERLKLYDAWAKDLFPADPVEQLCYRAWQDDRDPEKALRFLKKYFNLDASVLKTMADRSYEAELILETGCTFAEVKAILEVQ